MGLGPAQGRGDRKNGARGNKARVAPLGFVSGGVLKGKGRHKRPGGGSQAPQKNKRNQNVVADQRVAARGKRKEGGDKVPAPPVAKAKEQDSAKARADGDDGLLGITEDVRRHVWPDGALKGDEELEARLRHATVERRTNDDDKIGALLMQNLDALVEGVNVDALVRGSMARWDGDHDVDDNHDDGVVRGEVEAFEERLRAIAGLEPGEAGSDRGIGGLSVGSMDGERVDDDGRGMESDELDQASLDEEDDDLSSAYSNGKRSRYNLPVEASSQDSKDSDAESEEMKRESYEEGENDSTIAKLDAEEEEMLRGEVANVASLATLPSDMADLLPYDEMDESVEQGLSSYEVPPGGEEELARWREGKSTRAVAPRVRNRDRVEPTFVKDPAALELVDEEDTAPVISATFRDQLLAPAQPPPKLKENALAFRARVGMSKGERVLSATIEWLTPSILSCNPTESCLLSTESCLL